MGGDGRLAYRDHVSSDSGAGSGSWWCRHQTAIDVAMAGGFVVLDTSVTLAGNSWWPAHPGPLAWAMLIAQAAACASLAARRRAPLAVVAILAAFTVAISLLIWPAGALVPAHPATVWAPYATVVAGYGPFFYQPNRRAALAAIAVLTLVVARPWQPSATVITAGVLRTAAGPLVAMYVDARRRLVAALRERAERAEQEQHLRAEQARAEERARLAGEMHDVVTHRVSLMVLQAGALRITAPDEATRQAAEDLRAAGCQALDELRDLVGILRTAGEDNQTPSTPGLPALIAESTGVGTPADLAQEGDPALASPVVGRTTYRIVREALTNVRKHAPGARVTVQVSYAESGVRLTVRNTAPPARNSHPGVPPGPYLAGTDRAGTDLAGTDLAGSDLAGSDLAGTGSGLGIASLRQRVELVHGTLRAGGTADGGFCVEATLPAYVPTPEPAA
jgi:signal transduction histidine kinase